MSEKTVSKKDTIFRENPYDIEVIFESLYVASNSDYELIYMDRIIDALRKDSDADITKVSYEILKEMDLL